MSDFDAMLHLSAEGLHWPGIRPALGDGMRPHKRTVVWVDGVFDMMHFGHQNMCRQARELGDYLIAGVNSDESVLKAKGQRPVMTNEERTVAVEACKWVDQVVGDVPYVLDSEYFDFLIRVLNVDIVVHGDDPCLDTEGRDVYENAKRRGMFRTVKRTEGVSTTELVSRMLNFSSDHHIPGHVNLTAGEIANKEHGGTPLQSAKRQKTSKLLPSTRRLAQFQGGRTPPPGARVIYMAGSWDLFHPGHISTLKRARALGDFLIVGVLDDETVNERRGSNWPIMNVFERALCVLGCKYVDDVVIGCPWAVTDDLMKTFNVSLVVQGSSQEPAIPRGYEDDPYAIPRAAGKYAEVASDSDLTAYKIVERVLAQKEERKANVAKKEAKEAAYYANKEYVPEL